MNGPNGARSNPVIVNGISSNGGISKNIEKQNKDDFQLVLTLLSDWKQIENGNISGTFEENEDGNCDETEAMDVEIIDGLPFETRPHILKIPSMTNPPLPRSKWYCNLLFLT